MVESKGSYFCVPTVRCYMGRSERTFETDGESGDIRRKIKENYVADRN